MSVTRHIISAINKFGFSRKSGGYNRVAFSDADIDARKWLVEFLHTEGFQAYMDPIGNVIGRWGNNKEPLIMSGSHTDTVPDGGAFDGTLGVAAAIAAMINLREADNELAYGMEVVSFADEEGRFGGMLGSQALSGQVTQSWIEQAQDADGVLLTDAMNAQGLDAFSALSCARQPGSLKAFVELHIEQGPILEYEKVSIGIATVISGICLLSIRLKGSANHSGTTPMDQRRDPMVGAASVINQIDTVLRQHGSDQSRITVGKIEAWPNTPHTIAGTVTFTIVIRDTEKAIMGVLQEALERTIATTASRHDLCNEITPMSWLDPVVLDSNLSEIATRSAARSGHSCQLMASGAGHDAQSMQAICPASLIFVPSQNGISHAPEELTSWDDIERGTDVLIEMVKSLTRKTI